MRPALAALIGAACFIVATCTPEPGPSTDTPGERIVGLSEAERGRFLLGRALFERVAVPQEGLGPLFNAERCSACHDQPVVGGGGTSVPVLKATRFSEGECSQLEAQGGDNIQRRATPLLVALGSGPEDIPPEATATAVVLAPPLFGLGLIEAILEEDLLRGADPEDADRDGISGRVPRLPDGRVARFGRKGDAATVGQFVETALRFELGFTTADHPNEEPRNGVPIPPGADPMPDPEMDAGAVGLLTDYVRLLAPLSAAAEGSEAPADSARRGGSLFAEVGCVRCHTPVLTTGDAPEPALRRKRIALYSDLLLHDLGGGAGDVCTAAAEPGEYRTAPLWGLRFRGPYMHGGTAPTLHDAILEHGGEASAVVAAYGARSEGDRALLLRFLSGL